MDDTHQKRVKSSTRTLLCLAWVGGAGRDQLPMGDEEDSCEAA